MNTVQKIKVPAGKLRLDGDTYQHREVLKKNGWTWDRQAGAWTRETKGLEVVIRKGCRLFRETSERNGLGNLVYVVVYDDGVSPTASRYDHDALDMV